MDRDCGKNGQACGLNREQPVRLAIEE